MAQRISGLNSLAILIAMAGACGQLGAASPPTLASAAAIRRLSRAEVARHPSARLRAIVLAYDWPGQGRAPELYLLQHGAGLRVRLPALFPELAPGDRVEVRGTVSPGVAHPILLASGLKILHTGALPPASMEDLGALEFASLDGQWVRVQGVAERAQPVPGGERMLLAQRNNQIWVLLPGARIAAASLIGARVEVAGVVHAQAGPNRLAFTLIAPTSELKLLRPAPRHPFSLPVLPISQLKLHLKAYPPLVHVRGIVLVQQPWGALTIQGRQGGGFYSLGRNLPTLRPCELADLVGFPVIAGETLTLANPRVRPGPMAHCPAPIRLHAQTPLTPALYDRRVEVVGRVVSLHLGPLRVAQSLALEVGNRIFYVEIAWPRAAAWASRLRTGALLRVRGAFYATMYAGALELGLYPGSPTDLRVLAQPSWWTGNRLRWLLFAILAALALALAGVVAYRMQFQRISRTVEARARQQRELESQLQQSRRLEALGRLTAGVAHDFNNLLTIILGRAELLLAGAVDPALQPQLKIIADAGQRAALLTGQLLAYSRRQVLHLQSVDLNAVITGLREMLRALMGDDVKLELRLAPRLDAVLADSGQLGQVIMNLASNARDAMPRGGVFEIATANCALQQAQAALFGTLPPGDYVQLSLRDTGIGMSPQVRERIFEPFFTTKHEGQGTGLGLASAYGIITQCQGGIRVESEPGRGATFIVVLPRARRAAAGESDSSGAAAAT